VEIEIFVVALIFAWICFAGLGIMYIAGQKGRPDAEGIILGLLFGPLGCLIDAQVLDFLNASGGGPSDRVD
jgi:hypothetical protein